MISCICNETGKTKMDALLEVFATLESIDYISKRELKYYLAKDALAAFCFINTVMSTIIPLG